MQQFTLFSLMQGQLASGSESSIGCSAKSLPPPFLPPFLPPSFTFSPPHLPPPPFSRPSLDWLTPTPQECQRVKAAETPGHSHHVKCTVPVFPRWLALRQRQHTSFYSHQGSRLVCKMQIKNVRPTRPQVNNASPAVVRLSSPPSVQWALIQMQTFILSWQSFCHGDPARLLHKHEPR